MGNGALTLVAAVLVHCVGAVARITPEQLLNPSVPAVAQTVQSGNLYDCKDPDTRKQALTQLLPGDPYGLDDDGDRIACDTLPSEGGTITGGAPIDNKPGRCLFDSGGPKSGPLSVMPNDSYPRVFPIKRGAIAIEASGVGEASCREAR